MGISGPQAFSLLAILALYPHPDPTLRCGPSPKAKAKVSGALSGSLRWEGWEWDLSLLPHSFLPCGFSTDTIDRHWNLFTLSFPSSYNSVSVLATTAAKGSIGETVKTNWISPVNIWGHQTVRWDWSVWEWGFLRGNHNVSVFSLGILDHNQVSSSLSDGTLAIYLWVSHRFRKMGSSPGWRMGTCREHYTHSWSPVAPAFGKNGGLVEFSILTHTLGDPHNSLWGVCAEAV